MNICTEIRNPLTCDMVSLGNPQVELNGFEENALGIPLSSCLTYGELKDKFENLGIIDGGGEARVFKVRCKKNGGLYALRLDCMMSNEGYMKSRENFYCRMIESQDKNPHRAKIFSAFWLQSKNYRSEHPFRNVPEGEFLRTDFMAPEADPYYHEVIIMELGEQNVEKTSKNIEPIIFEIQSVFNRFCLDHAGISSCDEKLRNYVWVSTENESYNGKLLKDFSYWQYSFGDNLDIYIPRQNFIPKRVDFGNWQLKDVGLKRNWKEILVKNAGVRIDELLKLYPKPNACDDAILDMGVLLKV